jgi:hypothetical protein
MQIGWDGAQFGISEGKCGKLLTFAGFFHENFVLPIRQTA